jgi:hypothetical protein
VPVLAAIKRRQACSELEVVGAKGGAMAEAPCGPLGCPEDTGGLLDAVEVLLHTSILPLPEAPALVRGSGVSFSRWCSCGVLSLTVHSGVWGIG